MVHLPSCQLHISVNRTAQIYLELHFCVELHTKKSRAPSPLRDYLCEFMPSLYIFLPTGLSSFTFKQQAPEYATIVKIES